MLGPAAEAWVHVLAQSQALHRKACWDTDWDEVVLGPAAEPWQQELALHRKACVETDWDELL